MNHLISIAFTFVPLTLFGLGFYALARVAGRAEEWDDAMPRQPRPGATIMTPRAPTESIAHLLHAHGYVPHEGDVGRVAHLISQALQTPQTPSNSDAIKLAELFERFQSCDHLWHDGRPLHLVAAAELRRLSAPFASGEVAAEPALTDAELEAMAEKHGARWNGSYWIVEDADLHPLLRAARTQGVSHE